MNLNTRVDQREIQVLIGRVGGDCGMENELHVGRLAHGGKQKGDETRTSGIKSSLLTLSISYILNSHSYLLTVCN